MSSEGESSRNSANGSSGNGANPNQHVPQQRLQQHQQQQQQHHQQQQLLHQQQQHQHHQQQQHQQNSASHAMSAHGAAHGYSGTGLHLAATNAQFHQQMSMLRDGGWMGAGPALSQMGLPFSNFQSMMNNQAFNRGGEGIHPQFFHGNNAKRHSQSDEHGGDPSSNRAQNATNLMQGQSMAAMNAGNMAAPGSSLAGNVAMLQRHLNSMGQPMSILGSAGAPLAGMSPGSFAANIATMQAMNSMGQHLASFGSAGGVAPAAAPGNMAAANSAMQHLRSTLPQNPSPFAGASARNIGRIEGVLSPPASSPMSAPSNSTGATHDAPPQCQQGSNHASEPAGSRKLPLNPNSTPSAPQNQYANSATNPPAPQSYSNPSQRPAAREISKLKTPSIQIKEKDKKTNKQKVTAKALPKSNKRPEKLAQNDSAQILADGAAVQRHNPLALQVPPDSDAPAADTSQCTSINGKGSSHSVPASTSPVAEASVNAAAEPKSMQQITQLSTEQNPESKRPASAPTSVDSSMEAVAPSTAATSKESTPAGDQANSSPKNEETVRPKPIQSPAVPSNGVTNQMKVAAAKPAELTPPKAQSSPTPPDTAVVKSPASTASTPNPANTTPCKSAKMSKSSDSQQLEYNPEQPIADPRVAAATNDVVALLQLYGPLSYTQLKFNIATQLGTQQPMQLFEGDRLQLVLDLLVELGVIHVVDTSPEASADLSINDVTYCFGCGIPRMDVVLPSEILEKIRDAGHEVMQIQRRMDFLKRALSGYDDSVESEEANEGTDGHIISDKAKDESNNSRKRKRDKEALSEDSAHNILKQMLTRHPEIAYDPVYAEALTMFNVDMSANDDRSGEKGNKAAKRPSASSLSSSGGGTKKKNKGRPPKSINTNNLKTGNADNDRPLSTSPVFEGDS